MMTKKPPIVAIIGSTRFKSQQLGYAQKLAVLDDLATVTRERDEARAEVARLKGHVRVLEMARTTRDEDLAKCLETDAKRHRKLDPNSYIPHVLCELAAAIREGQSTNHITTCRCPHGKAHHTPGGCEKCEDSGP